MIELAKGNPTVWQTHGDLIVKAQDWPGADDFAKRTKATMPPQLQQAIAQSEQEGDDPQAQQMQQQLQQMQQQAQQAIQEREQALQQMQAQMQQMEQELKSKQEVADAKTQELEIKGYEAETKRVELLMPFMTPEQLVALTSRTTGQAATPDDLVTSYMNRRAIEQPQLQTPGQIDQGMQQPQEQMPDMGQFMPPQGFSEEMVNGTNLPTQ